MMLTEEATQETHSLLPFDEELGGEGGEKFRRF
jgi:hypothetical protein